LPTIAATRPKTRLAEPLTARLSFPAHWVSEGGEFLHEANHSGRASWEAQSLTAVRINPVGAITRLEADIAQPVGLRASAENPYRTDRAVEVR
jgi:hypothetical protein